MEHTRDRADQLRARIASVESTLNDLKAELTEAKKNLPDSTLHNHRATNATNDASAWPLQNTEYQKYGRQMILPQIGLQGQLNLRRSKVLIIGLGGLGCPAAVYLAGAGVGCLGLVDDDRISLSNLHRQTLYTERDVGEYKVECAIRTLKERNSTISYHPHITRLSPAAALQLFPQHDLILDCTDHPSSRYFISDAAVLTGKPLISASALRTEGQLMVLNRIPKAPSESNQNNFCYRCIFPKPPPPESITPCNEGGILGPVVGVMGTLMATEAIKLLTSPSNTAVADAQPSLLLYSAYTSPPFRSIRLKGRRKDCISCSPTATITSESLTSGSLDYVAFCGFPASTNVLPEDERISPQELAKIHDDGSSHSVLIDVREPVEFAIAHIPASLNLPFSTITRDPETAISKLQSHIATHFPPTSTTTEKNTPQLRFICRLGNDSQLAVAKLKEVEGFRESEHWVCKGDVRGGLRGWRREVEGGFPDYG
ncbi:hypothetical protein ACLMJK_005705 [Lecanora helva]